MTIKSRQSKKGGLMLIVTTLLALLPSIFTGGSNDEEKKAIRNVIADYVKSGDHRSGELADKSMHSSFTQYLDFMGKGIGVSGRELYKQMLADKKIGGEKRSFSVEMLDIESNIAFAKVKIVSKTLVFYDYITLMKEKEKPWQIVSLTLTVKPVQ